MKEWVSERAQLKVDGQNGHSGPGVGDNYRRGTVAAHHPTSERKEIGARIRQVRRSEPCSAGPRGSQPGPK
jgi:hypothetical protein